MNVLVIGGTGNTGQHIVRRLLERGDRVRVLSRHAEQMTSLKGAEILGGSITAAASVKAAAEGMDAVIICVESANSSQSANAPEAVHHQGVVNVIEAVRQQRTHIVLVTQIYITRPQAYPSVANIIAARRLGENALRQSGLPYTIVRPSWLTDEAAGKQAIRLEQGDTGEGNIARTDVAQACVQALSDQAAQGKTFELYNAPGDPPSDWHELFVQLGPD
jgi:uncharacterized protein YbjT (DUF2867 family)